MIEQLYPISFLICLGALTGWFFYKEDTRKSKLLSAIFYLSVIVYVISWTLVGAEIGYKMKVLGREMAVLVAIPFFLSFFRKNKVVFVALLFAVLGGMDYFYFDNLKATFIQKEETTNVEAKNIKADENGELLIELKEGVGISSLDNLINKYHLNIRPAFDPKYKDATDLDDCYIIDVPNSWTSEITELIAALRSDESIKWVEMNELFELDPMELSVTRESPISKIDYGLNDPGVKDLWGFEAMDINTLYETLQFVKPKKKALVAVLDTGVDANHEDLKANYISSKTNSDSDQVGHGTHCAGIVAAVSNNGKGIASFSQTNEFVQVTSLKVLNFFGVGTQEAIIDGIIEAADLGADVLSISIGGLSNDIAQEAFTEAVSYANKQGAIVVVAAGNSDSNAIDYAPANTPGVITVSAMDTLMRRASFSNTVQDLEMGISAPGVNILSTYPKDKYQLLTGTSMATPYVAGLVGLMKSIKPDLTTEEVYEILNNTSLELESKRESGNLIQPGKAISRLIENFE